MYRYVVGDRAAGHVGFWSWLARSPRSVAEHDGKDGDRWREYWQFNAHWKKNLNII